jgi:CheY-like chemotaxis protein
MALAQVSQMQKLESLGQLTGGLAHDFNNLLMTILANLELLSKSVLNYPKAGRLIQSAIQAAEQGANLTRRMLAFARRQELRPEAVDVQRLIESMGDLLQRSLGPTIEIRMNFKDDLGAVRVDPNQFELALLNLALNARDAMPQGGILDIGVRCEAVQSDRLQTLGAGDYVCVAVTDNGGGMDEETLARAPEPFFTTKEVGKGTGLGLSMVFGLATQSGGAARIVSRLGQGTTVELWLPVVMSAVVVEARTSGTAPERSINSYVILVVDDDPLVAEATASMLEELDHRPIVALSGPIALDTVRNEPKIDLVITDQVMPGMTGPELARHIRQMKPKMPMILATGYSEVLQHPDLPDMLRINKPYNLDELAAIIIRLMARPPIVLREGSLRRA